MDRMLYIWLALGALLAIVNGQTITPTNSTSTDGDQQKIGISVSVGEDMVLVGPVLGLTSNASKAIPPTGVSGPIFLTNAQSYGKISPRLISLLLCDPYVGEISVSNVFNQAVTTNVSAIVLYSQYSDGCSLEGYANSYPWIYSMKSSNETSTLLKKVNTPDSDRNGQVYAAIGQMNAIQGSHPAAASGNNGDSSSSSGHNHQNQNENPLGPSPSTAVAMIILYSITGIITALFLVIIITGALRAHRHPERYGPRNTIGRTRQSRARGLARAMLETLPIVKFGDNGQPKPTDVELADNPANRETTTEQTATVTEQATEGTPRETTEHSTQPRESVEGGIAAAVMNGNQPTSQTNKPDNLGCSICTEDFEAGQDQRVLPCDHRFHPTCIDPWLLNVSGTCPLCRIDLRPENSPNPEAGGEVDENGNPILREGQFDSELAPPLDGNATDGDRQRISIRRSIAIGIMGIGRPDRMSREEGVAALQRAAREGQGSSAATQEEEVSRRARLRSIFGIRTRRTGQTEEVQQQQQANREDAPER